MATKFEFPIYPDDELTYIAQERLLNEWADYQELVWINNQVIKKNIITIYVARAPKWKEDTAEVLKQAFYEFVEAELKTL
jgi:hypothetical protein